MDLNLLKEFYYRKLCPYGVDFPTNYTQAMVNEVVFIPKGQPY